MPLPKIQAARDLDDRALADRIAAVKRELFELRMKQATRQPVKPHEFKHARHELAQLLTVERERQQPAPEPAPAVEAEPAPEPAPDPEPEAAAPAVEPSNSAEEE